MTTHDEPEDDLSTLSGNPTDFRALSTTESRQLSHRVGPRIGFPALRPWWSHMPATARLELHIAPDAALRALLRHAGPEVWFVVDHGIQRELVWYQGSPEAVLALLDEPAALLHADHYIISPLWRWLLALPRLGPWHVLGLDAPLFREQLGSL